MFLFWECPCALAVNQKCIVMIDTAYRHLLSEGLSQENGEENTNSTQFATSKSSSKYFPESLFQAAGGHCLYIFVGLCTTPSSYTQSLSNKASKLCFFSFLSSMHLFDIGHRTLHTTDPQFYGLCFCSFCSRFQIRPGTTQSDKHKPLFLNWAKASYRFAGRPVWHSEEWSSSRCSGYNQKTLHRVVQQFLEAAAQLWKEDRDAVLHLVSFASNDRRCHVSGSNSSYKLNLHSRMAHFCNVYLYSSSCCNTSWTQTENDRDTYDRTC